MLTRSNRIALHMVDALPLRSSWVGRDPPRGYPPVRLWRWWMTMALLILFTAVVVVATARILRAAF